MELHKRNHLFASKATAVDRWYLLASQDSGEQKGPFTWRQLSDEIALGVYPASSLVWNAGLKSWTAYAQIDPAFAVPNKTRLNDPVNLNLASVSMAKPPRFKIPADETELPSSLTQTRAFKISKRAGLFVSLTLLGFGGLFYQHRQVSPRLLLDELVQELPTQDFSTVKAYFLQNSLTSKGTPFISVSKNEGLNPTFYFFAPIADNEEVTLQLTGVPRTLLRRPHYESEQTVKMKNGWGKTLPFSDWHHSRLGKGIYSVSVLNKDKNILSKRSFFLVGARDEAYQNELLEYNRKLDAQAIQEGKDLSQYLDTLESLLNETNAEFHARITQSVVPGSAAEWDQLFAQIEAVFSTWTEKRMAQEFSLFQEFSQVLALGNRIKELHQNQANYLKAGTAKSSEKNAVLDLESHLLGEVSVLRTHLFKRSQSLGQSNPP